MATGGLVGGFWKPRGVSHQQVIRDENEQSSSELSSASLLFSAISAAPLAQQRLLLPIYKHKLQILYALERYMVVVIVGEAGSGKSTQVMQYLAENGWAEDGFQLVCTQPRRIAAQTLAKRVAQEMGCPLGTKVGYTVRFDDCTSPNSTKIKFVTDGLLLREAAMTDPLLARYSVIMIDEAHERNCNSDALLGILKKIQRKRKNLRIIICSATIDAQEFLDFFLPRTRKRSREGSASKGLPIDESSSVSNREEGTIISVDGRQHPVDIQYVQEPVSDYVRVAVETVLKIHQQENSGDVLIFLSSGEEIDRAIRLAEEQIDQIDMRMKLSLLPLYSSLPYHMQIRVFQPRTSSDQNRRAIFATNIAECSVTVPNIAYVIDCGFAKVPYYDAKNGFERLVVAPISQASSRQRAGRSGRVRAGKCFRLYTEEYMVEKMQVATPPEILRMNLSGFLLSLKALGVDNIMAFDLMTMPSVEALSHGLECLFALGAIDDKTKLTDLGLRMANFPTEPRVSRMLLTSLELQNSWEVLGIASCLQVRSLLLQPRTQRQRLEYDSAIADFVDRSGDHVTLANLISEMDDQQWNREDCQERFVNYLALQRALEVRNQLARFLRSYGEVRALGTIDVNERSRALRKCVAAGFFMNVAKLNNDGHYYTLRGKHRLTPSKASILHSHGAVSEYIVFGETNDAAEGGMETRMNSTVEAKWLKELAPHYWE